MSLLRREKLLEASREVADISNLDIDTVYEVLDDMLGSLLDSAALFEDDAYENIY